MKYVTLLALSMAIPALAAGAETSTDELESSLRAAETAFAATMAKRDHAAFVSHLADEVIFFSGNRSMRGKPEVAAGWKPYFKDKVAPFSWEPAVAVVLDSGDLGLTSGPVHDAKGRRVGTFNSVWRRSPDGTWRIVFDRGCPPCDCGSAGAP